ncbi:hypothetical protein GQ55_2G297500 [Panicum hallii var. hallii]|uniref:Uncharacterized protein n=1 Tax=Panicum hallii var. hallii TaxID=1504633 RepID=A0A2T7ETQ9_9POAL|nr:hypothetical protein GQ55_2G297500 [Panicum hallii var. hallii]
MMEMRKGQNLMLPPLVILGKPPKMSEEPTPRLDMASTSPPLRRRTLESQQHRKMRPRRSVGPHPLQRRRGRRRPQEAGGPGGFGAGMEIALGSPFLL